MMREKVKGRGEEKERRKGSKAHTRKGEKRKERSMLNRAKEVSMRGWLHARARCIDSAVASLLARALERRASEEEPRGGHTGQHNKTEQKRMCAGTSGALALAGAQTEVPRAVVSA